MSGRTGDTSSVYASGRVFVPAGFTKGVDMSLLNQSYSPEFMASLSSDDRVTLVKAMIVEYQESHTKEEFDQYVDLLESKAARK